MYPNRVCPLAPPQRALLHLLQDALNQDAIYSLGINRQIGSCCCLASARSEGASTSGHCFGLVGWVLSLNAPNMPTVINTKFQVRISMFTPKQGATLITSRCPSHIILFLSLKHNNRLSLQNCLSIPPKCLFLPLSLPVPYCL